MKIIKKIIFSLLLIIPFYVYAAGGVTINKTSITLNEGGSTTFTITTDNAAGKVDIVPSNTNVVTVDKSKIFVDAVRSTEVQTITVTAVHPGTTTISVQIDVATYDLEEIITTKTINVTVNGTSSSNNYLSSLKVDNTLVNGFSSNVTSYSMNTTKSSVNITASAQDSHATVSGTGTKTLNMGSNPFSIVVTAQNGTKKTYYLTINRTENASSNNNLSSLKVDGVSVSNFSSSNLTYGITTDKNSINITATTEDTKASVSGVGTKTLKYGANSFNIVVTAENGSKKTYTLNVMKTDNRSSNNNLKDLKIDGELVEGFAANTTSYTVNTEKSSVVVSATVEDSKAKITGTGTKTIKYGNNTISIVVTAENETKKTYTLVIKREDTRETNSDLSSLTIGESNITFDKDVTAYMVEVDKNVTEINITATADGSKATISGLGVKKLNIGNNDFKIIVTAENGTKKTYTIRVVRKSTDEENVPQINQYSVNYSSDSYQYCSSDYEMSYFVQENERVGSLCTPSREGYTFNGWVDQDNNPVSSDTIVTKNLILTAKFTEIKEVVPEEKSSNNDTIMTIVIAVLIVISIIVIGIFYLQNKKR